MNNKLSPVLYIPHGGGPLPFLGDAFHKDMVKFLKTIPNRLGNPKAIVLISAHWEEEKVKITSGKNPELIYDYYGFPEESYKIQYSACGDAQLAQEVSQLLQQNGTQVKLDANRGFDHGMFIPLKIMYPDGNIPCIQLSLMESLSPAEHIQLGKSLSVLRKKNILVVGSGMSFHNMMEFFSSRTANSNDKNNRFTDWLVETCTNQNILSEERDKRLEKWEEAPFARFCHPREEHLLPLHVCYGIASLESPLAELVFDEKVMGKRVVSFLWE